MATQQDPPYSAQSNQADHKENSINIEMDCFLHFGGSSQK